MTAANRRLSLAPGSPGKHLPLEGGGRRNAAGGGDPPTNHHHTPDIRSDPPPQGAGKERLAPAVARMLAMPSSKSGERRARRAGRGGRHRHDSSEQAAVTRPGHPGKHLPLEGGGRRKAAGGGDPPKPPTITPPRTYGPTLPLKGRVRKVGARSYEDAGDAKQQKRRTKGKMGRLGR
jgi:excinuclease ABC subunit B